MGEPPAEFKWVIGCVQLDLDEHLKLSFNQISHYPKNVDPIHEMNNDANDTEKQFRLYEYHVNDKVTFHTIKVTITRILVPQQNQHLTTMIMKRVVCSCINRRKILI